MNGFDAEFRPERPGSAGDARRPQISNDDASRASFAERLDACESLPVESARVEAGPAHALELTVHEGIAAGRTRREVLASIVGERAEALLGGALPERLVARIARTLDGDPAVAQLYASIALQGGAR